MKIDHAEMRKQKRLKAIKKTYPLLFFRSCRCCGNDFVRERMWKVCRRSINHYSFFTYYCKDCAPTKDDVLHEIDTDTFYFGIAHIDDHEWPEKDWSKYRKWSDECTRVILDGKRNGEYYDSKQRLHSRYNENSRNV